MYIIGSRGIGENSVVLFRFSSNSCSYNSTERSRIMVLVRCVSSSRNERESKAFNEQSR